MIRTRVPDVVSLPCKVVVAGHMAINNCTKTFVRECQVVCSSSSGDSLIQGDENGASSDNAALCRPFWPKFWLR